MTGPANGRVEPPLRNPYARDKRVAMNHRVYEGITAAIAELSADLEAEGYPSRQVSQAELVQAILWRYTPRDVEEAGRLLQEWAMLRAAPPVPLGDRERVSRAVPHT